MIDTPTPWIALLDDDEDDFMFWQYGFDNWAKTISLKWFVSAESFLGEAAKAANRPTAIVLDGVVPTDDQEAWLTTFLGHVCCQNIPVFMLSGQFNQEQQQRFLALGASGYLVKPTSFQELQDIILKVVDKQGPPVASL
ncbi:response regulator [Spirosoma sp. KCTC 42546]|uniref:response regulator n=1 Tax=Spirosoma sp. KCTC 42546 TaxID=2520506 RepID=UPI00115AF6E6|nr:response regulator [Spirosoma sp. KCTC 42546]QDK77786.1 response regulator [Spirosoma sp. KCTC 42546]